MDYLKFLRKRIPMLLTLLQKYRDETTKVINAALKKSGAGNKKIADSSIETKGDRDRAKVENSKDQKDTANAV